MSLNSFFSRHPLLALLTASLLVCGSAEVAGTQIQLGIDQQVQASPSNPHRIPEDMDPKSSALADEIRMIKYEIKEEVVEAGETMHSVAFQEHRAQSQPTLDYTTGTSN